MSGNTARSKWSGCRGCSCLGAPCPPPAPEPALLQDGQHLRLVVLVGDAGGRRVGQGGAGWVSWQRKLPARGAGPGSADGTSPSMYLMRDKARQGRWLEQAHLRIMTVHRASGRPLCASSRSNANCRRSTWDCGAVHLSVPAIQGPSGQGTAAWSAISTTPPWHLLTSAGL